MSRLGCILVALSCFLFTLNSVGCGGGNSVIEQTGASAESQAELDEQQEEEERAEKAAAAGGDS